MRFRIQLCPPMATSLAPAQVFFGEGEGLLVGLLGLGFEAKDSKNTGP